MDDPFARTTDDSPEAQIEAIKTYAAQLPLDPSLRTLGEGHSAAAIDAPIPEVQATPTEEKFKDFATDTVTHVVISATLARQSDIFRHIGYQYDWNRPGPFWDFLGKMVAKGVFDGKTEVRELNYCAIRRREFIGYTTTFWGPAVEAEREPGKARPPVSAIEVNFKKPQPGQPLKMTWAPARPLIAAKVGQMKHSSDRSSEADLSEDEQDKSQSS